MKKMRFLSGMTAGIMLLAQLAAAEPALPVPAAAATMMSTAEILKDMKIGWGLGNTLDAYGTGTATDTETAWGNPQTTKAMIDAVKEKGFNTVRIPVTWWPHMAADYKVNAKWMDRVQEVVDYAIADGMYVILNAHHEDWINRSDLGTAYEEIRPELLSLWAQIAERFQDYDQHLIFEAMNEPRLAGTTYEWMFSSTNTACLNAANTINQLNADFVELIRSSDSPYSAGRLLMIPGYCASTATDALEQITVPDDDYVAVSVHAYVPYNFALNTSSGSSQFSEADSKEISTVFSNLKTTLTSKGIPVIIGEFGAIDRGNTSDRVQWAEAFVSEAKSAGIPCVLWDNNASGTSGENLGCLNRSTLSWYSSSEPMVDKMMEVLAPTVVASGECGTGLTWTLDRDGTLTISGTGSMTRYSSSGAPWYDYRDSIRNVVIEQGVLSIGDYAFSGCAYLESVSLPKGLTQLRSDLFVGCSLLREIRIPSSVTSIYYDTFAKCGGLRNIEVDDGNTTFNSVGGVLYDIETDGKGLKYYPEGRTSDYYVVQNGTELLSGNAFSYNQSLKSIYLPQTIKKTTHIDQIIGCPNLKTVYGYPDSGAPEIASEYGLEFISMEEQTTAAGPSATTADSAVSTTTTTTTVTTTTTTTTSPPPETTEPETMPPDSWSYAFGADTGSCRVNYWSEDSALTFDGLKVSLTLYQNNNPVINVDVTEAVMPDPEAQYPYQIWKGPEQLRYHVGIILKDAALVKDVIDHTGYNSAEFVFEEGQTVGEIEIFIGMRGDLNRDGRVSAADAQIVLDYYGDQLAMMGTPLAGDAEYGGSNGILAHMADVDNDGFVNITDAQHILRYYVKQLAGFTDVIWLAS